MGIFDISPGSVSPVEILSQFSGPGVDGIVQGNAVYRNPTTGWITPCGTANMAEGIAITATGWNGHGMTAVRKGLLDLGGSALTPYNFGAPIYVHGHAGGSALGSLGVAPQLGGTFQIGYITGVSQSLSANGTLGTDKLLFVDL